MCLTVTIRVRHRCLTADSPKTLGKQTLFFVRKKWDSLLSYDVISGVGCCGSPPMHVTTDAYPS